MAPAEPEYTPAAGDRVVVIPTGQAGRVELVTPNAWVKVLEDGEDAVRSYRYAQLRPE